MIVKAFEVRGVPGYPGYRVSSDGRVWSCMSTGCKPKRTKKWKQLCSGNIWTHV